MASFGADHLFQYEWLSVMTAMGNGTVTDPEMVREVSLVSMSDRRFSPAVLTFIHAIRAHGWSRGEP